MNEKEGGQLTGRKPIKGEVMCVEYGDYFAKGQDGKEVCLHTDKNTQMMGQIRKGDRIEQVGSWPSFINVEQVFMKVRCEAYGRETRRVFGALKSGGARTPKPLCRSRLGILSVSKTIPAQYICNIRSSGRE